MRLVACSDPHFDRVTCGVPRFEEVKDSMKATVEAAIEHRATAWLCLGDIMDPDCGPVAFKVLELLLSLTTRLLSHGIRPVFLAGNHDVVESGEGTSTLTPLRSVKGVSLFERPGTLDLGEGVELLALPFTPSSHGYDVAEFVRDNLRPGMVVLSHLVVPGITPGSETTEMPRGREVRLPVDLLKENLVLQGHFHKRQIFEGNIHVIGSLARLTFGEEQNEPGYLLVEV
jgi:DNA repair exonuclease SbcCD nuclease subunit